MKNLTRSILAVAAMVSAVPAMAQFQKPEDATKYRQGSFTVMAAHFAASEPWRMAVSRLTPNRRKTTQRWSSS
jgi:hypothetical protein